MGQTTSDELQKILRIMDQTITAHSILHDQNKRMAFISELLLMGAAIFLTILSIADDQYFLFFSLKPADVKSYVSIYSVIALIVNILAWKIDWRGQSLIHGQARERLSQLKLECRKALSDPNVEDECLIKLCRDCNVRQSELEPIPENKFNALKIKHLKKVEFSKFSSIHAGKPHWLIWILFYKEIVFSKGTTDLNYP